MTDLPKFKVAKSATIESLPNGGKSLLLDGEHFPYHISTEGPTVERVGNGVYIINIPVLVFGDAGDGVIHVAD